MKTIAIIFLTYLVIKYLGRILAPILLRNITIKMQDRFKDQFHRKHTQSEDAFQEEGKITIEKTNTSSKKSKDIGDYVDFEEVE